MQATFSPDTEALRNLPDADLQHIHAACERARDRLLAVSPRAIWPQLARAIGAEALELAGVRIGTDLHGADLALGVCSA